MEELIRVLEKTVSSSQADQNDAVRYISECVQTDLTNFLQALADILYNPQNSPVVRAAAGLQLKNQLTARDQKLRSQQQARWRDLPESARTYIKERVSKALGTEIFRPSSAPQCIAYIAVAELTEKQWPNFISALVQNAKAPHSDDKLRLATLEAIGYICQEIISTEHQQPSKKKETTNGLNASMSIIYTYIAECINSQNYDLMTTSLQCLCGLMSWAEISPDLLGFLCQLMRTYEAVQLTYEHLSEQKLTIISAACDCLNVCLERKHSKTDSFEVRTSLFETYANLCAITTTLNQVHSAPYDQSPQALFEAEKKLCLLMTNLMRYVYICQPEKPQNLAEMYSIMKSVHTHPSVTVSMEATRFWNKVFAITPKKLTDEELIASLLITCANKLIKQEYDAKLYGHEFDCQQDLDDFQARFRTETCELCKNLTQQNDRICFELVSRSIAKSIEERNTNINEWDAISCLSAAVYNRLKDPSIYVAGGTELVRALMMRMESSLQHAATIPADSNGQDASLIPDLISTQLSCLSAMYVFLPYWHQTDKELTKSLLRKVILFAFHRPDKFIGSSRQLVGNNTQLLSNESFLRGFRGLSRHASANFVRCCMNHSKHLLDIFDFLKESIDYLYSAAVDNPFSTEKCQLYEGLTLICNELPDEVAKKKFVIELLESISWFKDYELSCEQFIEFVGLNRFEADQESIVFQNTISQIPTPSTQTNRVKLNYAISFIGAIAKRLNSRNTLLPEILTFAKPILNLMFTMHALWLPEMKAKCVKEYQPFLFAPFHSSYKQQILDTILVQNSNSGDNSSPFGDISSRPSKGSSSQYIELFSWNFYETLLITMGTIISKTSPELLNFVSPTQLQTALTGADNLPPSKMHKLIKHFIMPLIVSCSKDQHLIETQLWPLLSELLPYLFNALDNQWKCIAKDDDNQMNGTCDSKLDQSHVLADEMVQDQLLRNLSRDFIDLMNMILIDSVQPTSTIAGSDMVKSDLASPIHNNSRQPSQVEHKISMLGIFFLSGCPDFMLKVMGSTLTWSDSILNFKSSFINQHLIRHILNSNTVNSSAEASQWLGAMFESVITSLKMFGEHEQNHANILTLFVMLYESLNSVVPNFHDQLQRMTGIDKNAFLRYDRDAVKLNDKNRRAALRKLLDSLVVKKADPISQ